MAIEIKPPAPAPLSGVYNLKKAQGTEGTQQQPPQGTSFSVQSTQSPHTAGTEHVQHSGSMADVEGIFLAVLNPDEAKNRGVQYGSDLLGKLEQVRVQIATGRIEIDTLNKIDKLLGERLDNFPVDPQLKGILTEIQTLAAVERAKLGA